MVRLEHFDLLTPSQDCIKAPCPAPRHARPPYRSYRNPHFVCNREIRRVSVRLATAFFQKTGMFCQAFHQKPPSHRPPPPSLLPSARNNTRNNIRNIEECFACHSAIHAELYDEDIVVCTSLMSMMSFKEPPFLFSESERWVCCWRWKHFLLIKVYVLGMRHAVPSAPSPRAAMSPPPPSPVANSRSTASYACAPSFNLRRSAWEIGTWTRDGFIEEDAVGEVVLVDVVSFYIIDDGIKVGCRKPFSYSTTSYLELEWGMWNTRRNQFHRNQMIL